MVYDTNGYAIKHFFIDKWFNEIYDFYFKDISSETPGYNFEIRFYWNSLKQ